MQKNKRNIVTKIQQLRGRQKFNTYSQISQVFRQMRRLVTELKTTDKPSNKELLKYIS
jgi:hypothetical protein